MPWEVIFSLMFPVEFSCPSHESTPDLLKTNYCGNNTVLFRVLISPLLLHTGTTFPSARLLPFPHLCRWKLSSLL